MISKDLTLADLEAIKSLITFHDDLVELEEHIGVNADDLYNKINNLMLDHRLES